MSTATAVEAATTAASTMEAACGTAAEATAAAISTSCAAAGVAASRTARIAACAASVSVVIPVGVAVCIAATVPTAIPVPSAVAVAATEPVAISAAPVIPRANADEEATVKPAGTVVAIRRASIRIIGVIAPLAIRRAVVSRRRNHFGTDAHSNRYLGIRRGDNREWNNNKHCQ
jgi:hypothetical protein